MPHIFHLLIATRTRATETRDTYGQTVVQLVQFALGIAHALQIYYVPGCEYPKPIATFELLEAMYFFGVFFNFYRKSYWKNHIQKKTEEKSS